MMLFQSDIAERPFFPETWKRLGVLGNETQALRDYYRSGDASIHIDKQGDNGSIVTGTYSPGVLIINAINIDTNGGYSDLFCGIGLSQHWNVSVQRSTL